MYHMYNCPEWDGRIPKFFKKHCVIDQALLSSFVIFYIYGIVGIVINAGSVKTIAVIYMYKNSSPSSPEPN